MTHGPFAAIAPGARALYKKTLHCHVKESLLWNHDCCYCCYGYLCLKSEPRKHLGPPDDGISTLFAQVFSAVIPCVQKPNHARIIYVSVKRKSEFLAVAGRQLQFSAAPI